MTNDVFFTTRFWDCDGWWQALRPRWHRWFSWWLYEYIGTRCPNNTSPKPGV